MNDRTTAAARLRAKAMLAEDAAALVKPGGALVYCTCSLEPEEGERAVAAAQDREACGHPVEQVEHADEEVDALLVCES